MVNNTHPSTYSCFFLLYAACMPRKSQVEPFSQRDRWKIELTNFPRHCKNQLSNSANKTNNAEVERVTDRYSRFNGVVSVSCTDVIEVSRYHRQRVHLVRVLNPSTYSCRISCGIWTYKACYETSKPNLLVGERKQFNQPDPGTDLRPSEPAFRLKHWQGRIVEDARKHIPLEHEDFPMSC